jgi:amino acid adenylation domain-containing protein
MGNNGKFSCYIIGDGALLIACGELIIDSGHDIYGVISSNPLIREWAEDKGIKCVDHGSDYSEFLKQEPFDYLFSIVYLNLIPKELLALPKKMAINFHDALLPEYAGIHATSWAIMNKETRHGITWHEMVSEVDKGNILKQKTVEIEDNETAFSLNVKCYEVGLESFTELLDELAADSYALTFQDLNRRTYYGKYKRPPVGCVFSWKSSAEEMDAIVRALQFGKYQNKLGIAKLAVADEYIIVDHIRVTRNKSDLKPGTIVDITELNFKVATVSNDIEISSVMSINGAPLPVADCIKKYNLKLGDSLVEMDSETGTRITLLHDEISKCEDYWINKLLHIDPTIFPGIVQVLEDKYSTNYSVVDFTIADEFINYTKKDYSNMLAGYLAAISSFLFKECKKDSIQVSIGYKELSEDLKGVNNLFAVHVPVKLELNDTLAFRDVCDIAREEIESVKKHKTFLHDLIVRSPQLNDNSILLGRTVLPIIIEYVKDFENYSQATLNRQGISFVIPEKGNTCRIVFSEEVLAKEKAAIYSNRLTTFIERVAAMPETPLSKLTTLADDELHRVIYERNNTAVDYPRDKCMHELFKERVKQYPEKIAVLYKDENLTYMELEKRASRLASFLNRTGVRRGSLVGIFIERSLDMLVGLLGVLKAGGTYVPIDPIYPSERILHMIEDADIQMVLTQEKIEHKLPQSDVKTVCLDKDWEEICKDSGKSSSRKYYSYSNKNTSPEDSAYVIFTSGSTGRPKGVEVTHRGLTNFLCSMERYPGFTNEDRILALTTICFDIAGLELYLPLITGGQVEILPTEIARDGFELKEKIENGIATIVQATPATWEMLLEAGWNRKVPIKILCGGEALSVELAQKLLDRSSEVWNMYGPTETTIWSSVSRVNSGEEITVGQPIANTQFYIVDEYLNPVPDGMEGELCIGGKGLAKGYLNRPDLTKEKFILNPFDTEKKCKIYKTGDSAKYLPDGRVICLGRIDNQVKLRGFRIELGEIESVLEKQPQINKAVVVVKEDNTGYKSLAAFIVPEKSTIPVPVKKLSEAVKEFLPEYMVPVSYTFMDILPLTLNLKVDRKILESMPTAQIMEKYGYKESNNDIDIHKQENRIKTKIIDCKDEYEDLTEYFEKDLAEIVAEVVKTPKEGIDLDVPMGEYGYDSIRFTVLSKRLKDKYDIVITPAQFYTYTTINKLKEYILNVFKEQIEEYYGKKMNLGRKEQLYEDIPLILERCEFISEDKDFGRHFEKDIREIVAEVVKIPKEEIDTGVPMGEYGYDSIRFTVLSKKIKDKYAIVITPAQFYTYTTIHKVTDFIVSKYKEQLQRYYSINIAAATKSASNDSMTDELKEKKKSFAYGLHQLVDRDSRQYQREPVAIIGISGIFPQSPDLETFWDNIVNKRDLITEISDDRWNASNYYIKMAEENNIAYSKWGGFIEDVDKFDAAFFNISPREAERMDPQQRIFLEIAWKAIENAGYKPSDLSGTKTGVYVGAVSSDYWDMMLCTGLEADSYTISGNVNCVIANRISYLLNLHGASASIDTACSSSLVAVHRAVAAIQNGYCDMAIAGGVNVILNPFMHIALSTNGMLSADGQCKTFDSRANGYVRGEGAGALILKPLSKAIADGDYIHAVIRGSCENHGGRTNSLTAPSPNAQADLLFSAYTEAEIDPSTVTYIEAHGTGTSLGDPIEINGLKMAFEELHKEWGMQSTDKYCGLGSVKTNIGHLEAGAGVAGLLKIVLAMKKGLLPGMIHFKEQNPFIDLEGSPFYIVSETQEWGRLTDNVGKIVPRRAGVSSFGFGGSNSHIVLEEYCSSRSSSTENYHSPNVFVLSAKSEDRLKAYAMDMLAYLEGILLQKENGESVEADFDDIMYTSQVGREVMNKRLAIVASDIKELVEKLKRVCIGETEISQVYIGSTERENKSIKTLLEGICNEEFVASIIRQKEYKKLAQLWVAGVLVNWNLLYSNLKSRRISLPTYPFTKECYWIPKSEIKSISNGVGAIKEAYIHPLLHKNTSNFSEQRFSSTFTGQEFFLADHIVKGQRVLPEVAYLEMAREAVTQATGSLVKGQGVRLKNVVWAQPIVIGEHEIQVHIGLFPEDNGVITYEIYSQSEENSEDAIVHSQGSAILLNLTKEVQTLDIKTLQAECSQSALSQTQCYETLRKMGIIYGPDNQRIEKVYVGSGQILAKLSLPSSLSNTQNQFVLHPSLLGAALQSSVVLMMGSNVCNLPLPFALRELESFHKCTPIMWALVRYSDGSKGEDKVQKIDIDLCDETGVLCVRMTGIEVSLVGEEYFELEGVNVSKAKPEGHGEILNAKNTQTLIVASINHIKGLISEATKIPIDGLDSEASFEGVGLDSIIISHLNKKIEQWVGKLDATLFFKYENIKTLAAYFVEDYPDAVDRLINKRNELISAKKEQTASYVPKKPILQSVKELRSRRSSALNVNTVNDIAIIGVAGRYPKATTLEQFWKNLYEGKDCIEEIPPNRWSLDGFFEPDRTKAIEKGLSYSKWGGFLDNIDHFDPLFFNISPRDAMFMDPQERLFLEVAWECLEKSGYTREALKKDGYGNQIGVFVGATYNNYQLFMTEAAQRANQDMYAANSQIFSIANRVSYFMNFTGPSLTVDTACSSSLYAIHLACESIRSGQSCMALAGGVNLSLHPSKYITLSKGQFSASDGRCRAFCEGGTGYVPSEAVGAVFLKPLQEAISDNDFIYGVIKGTATSHAGKSNGYTVPNPVSQSLVIESALRKSQINPRSISCIEAHGTGTALGDPIEITGLTDVFRKYTKETEFCSISSVKSSIGHAEAAAGIAQLTKVLLQFKHQTLVKNVMHGNRLNPNIDFAQTPFVVQEKTEYWKRPIINGQEVPRRAGISSFGAGGANAHIVVEEYISRYQELPKIEINHQNPAIIVLSAKNRERLKEQVRQLLKAIEEQHFIDQDLGDLAYTLQVGREAMEERLSVIVESTKELEEKLKHFLEDKNESVGVYYGKVSRNKEKIFILSAEEWQNDIEEWIKCKQYRKLIDGWIKGMIFDWNKLYRDNKPRRISLPTYPFSKERYWIQEKKEPIVTTLSHQSQIQFDETFYEQLIDEIMTDDISIDTAVQKIKAICK